MSTAIMPAAVPEWVAFDVEYTEQIAKAALEQFEHIGIVTTQFQIHLLLRMAAM
jgi:hypothetical protein